MATPYNPIPKEELQARYWFLSHLSGAHKVALWAFMAFDSLLMLIVLGFLINLYGIQLFSYPRSLREMAQPVFRTDPVSQPVAPLNMIETGGLSPSNDRSDLYALVQNPNTGFMARFTYSFLYNGASQGSYQAFLYPSEQKYLVGLALPPLSGAGAQLQITNLQWIRISDGGAQTIKEQTGLVTSNYLFTQSTADIPFNRLTFTLENKTGYDFSNIALPVVLRYGSRVVALNSTIIDHVMAGKSRTVDLRWFTPVGPVDAYAITPTIDVFDPLTFITPPGEQLPASEDN